MAVSHLRWPAHRILFVIIVCALVAAMIEQVTAFSRPLSVFAFVLTASYLGWMLAEARITFSRADPPNPRDPTLLPYALVRSCTVVVAVLIPLPWPIFSWWMVIPAVVFASGVALRQWAVVMLGRFYSHRLLRRPDHTVVTSGPYAVVRHPAYTGMIIANLGFVALFFNVFSVAGLALLVAVLTWRIGREERLLSAIPSYVSYAMSTPCLIPGLW
jgi:protein-S-isoprenylcysteine O-methyltransferase Ste14